MLSTRMFGAAALVAALTSAGAARAADDDRQGDVNVFLKGGLSSFTGELADVTGAGPAWGVALNLQPFNVVGFEVGYDGTKNDLDDDRAGGSARLTRHGATGLVRLSPPFVERIKPFVATGLGASYVRVSDDDSGLYRNDFLEEVPVVAGLEFNTGALTAGLRGTYRFLFDERFAERAQPGNPEGALFDAALTVGGRF